MTSLRFPTIFALALGLHCRPAEPQRSPTTGGNAKMETTMNSNCNTHFDLDLIQDVSADEAENVTGGGIFRGSGFDDPEPPPPPPGPDGQLVDI
jgi:hypothetical protein